MTPLYIFDLDGTLANIEHRLHHVRLRVGSHVKLIGSQPARYGTTVAAQTDATGAVVGFDVQWDEGFKLYAPNHNLKLVSDWDAFHAACVDDVPIPEMVELCRALYAMWGPDGVQIWSGRSDAVRGGTVDWVVKHLGYGRLITFRMRPAGDHTSDERLKESWLHAMSPEDRARLRMVFDDRQRVVDMWRRNGVRCCQVAPGDF